MHHHVLMIFLVLAGSMVSGSCAMHSSDGPPSSNPPRPVASPTLTSPNGDRLRDTSPSRTATDQSAPDSEMHAKYSAAFGGGPRSTIDPSRTIPSPPATIDVPTDAGVAAAISAVPNQIPVGRLPRDTLESPLKDATRFERCSIPRTTRVQIGVAIYNGQAIGVDVRSNPTNRSLNFCVERIVRQTTWVKELAINKVNVTL